MNTRAKSDKDRPLCCSGVDDLSCLDKNLQVEREEPVLPVEPEDPLQLFIKQLQQEKIEMDEFLMSLLKPKKKKVNKVQLKKDLFELDFMCE